VFWNEALNLQGVRQTEIYKGTYYLQKLLICEFTICATIMHPYFKIYVEDYEFNWLGKRKGYFKFLETVYIGFYNRSFKNYNRVREKNIKHMVCLPFCYVCTKSRDLSPCYISLVLNEIRKSVALHITFWSKYLLSTLMPPMAFFRV